MEHQVILDHPFTYFHKESGENVEAKFILIVPFNMKQLEKAAPVKEIVNHSLANMSHRMDSDDKQDIADAQEQKAAEDSEKEENSKKEKKLEAKDGKALLSWVIMYSDKGDTAKFYAYMQKLLTCGVASIDAETPFNGSHINLLDPRDFEKICGEYIGNFINS